MFFKGILILFLVVSHAAHGQTKRVLHDRPNKIIVDRSGQKTAVPISINRIVVTCYGGASHEIAVLGAAHKIIAQPTMKAFPNFLRIYPVFNDVPDIGSFDTVNIEHLIKLNPDLVIAGITSSQTNEKIRKLGIPVVTVSTGHADIVNLIEEFQMMGDVLGMRKKADVLAGYWNDKLNFIRNRLSSISEKNRKKVLYISSSNGLKTDGRLRWGHHFITAAGGINVAQNFDSTQEPTLEQVLVWNPDLIVLTSGGHKILNTQDSQKNALNNIFKHIKMVECPSGTFWWHRPSPEAILGILWLSKVLYPSVFADLNFKHEVISFYQSFYGYSLNSNEYDAFKIAM